MKINLTLCIVLSIMSFFSIIFHNNAQRKRILEQDTTLNNLVHDKNYHTSELGTLPHVIKSGKGKKSMILIAGNGFGAEIFEDFMKSNKKKYKMYAITLPGFGNTQAPPMPHEGTSYGAYTWSRGVEEGILKLIENEKLDKPVLVGHFNFPTPIVFRLAKNNPHKIGSVVIISGVAKASFQQYPNLTLEKRIALTDKGMAPYWFKTVTRATWNDNNYPKELFCNDALKATELWKQSNNYPLPVLVRYLCEFNASDATLDFMKITIPTLVLIPGFNEEVLNNPDNVFIKTFFIDSWQNVEKNNKYFTVKTIKDSRTFMMIDQAEILNKTIYDFLKENKVI